MTKVAADYGVTGTALKKTCDRHHIPTPERGYWAKLEYGKRVTKEVLPPLTEPNLATIRISGSSDQHLSPSVREAKEKARDRLHKHAAAKQLMVPASESALSIVEPPCLAATRRTISKARPDSQGFAAARSKGVVPLKIAPLRIAGTVESAKPKSNPMARLPGRRHAPSVGISVETPAIFIRFWLATTPALPEPAAQAARAKAGERYEAFVTALGRRLAKGPKLRQEISEDVDRSGRPE